MNKSKYANTELHYSNWLKMVIDLISPKNLYLISGRGTGKTSDVLADRARDICYDMPGAPFAFVGDTYINLIKNTVKTFLEGWERLGWIEAHDNKVGHFVVDKPPPSYFHKPFTRLDTYKHTISVFNGCTFNLVSLDRPSTGAGNNYAHLFGDEAKYLKESKLKKLTPSIRGNYIKFGHSPFFRGRSFVSDYPDLNSSREDNWIIRMHKNMDKSQIQSILDCAFVLNDIRMQIHISEESKYKDLDKIKKLTLQLRRWTERYNRVRSNSTFFYLASSMVNVDILTNDYFFEQFQDLEFEDYKTSILTIKPSLASGARFYSNLDPAHFFSDGYNYNYYDSFTLKDNISQSSRGLRYVRTHEKLEAGVDFGNMCSMIIGQEQLPHYRILKNIHILSPLWINDLASQFLSFFQDHGRKEIDIYYDRSANTYSQQKQDFATKLKNSIEKESSGSGLVRSTGWKVNLMSLGQANINHSEEFDFMIELMSGKNPSLPKLLIDLFECKELKSSLELAKLTKDSKGNLKKDKKSETLPLLRLPLESTNYSDTFKYLLCRKKYLDYVKARKPVFMGDPSWRNIK